MRSFTVLVLSWPGLLVCLAMAVVGVVVVYCFNAYFKRSTLDVIPGPNPPFWLIGTLPLLYQPDSWKLHHEIAKTYGPIARLNSVMGSRELHVFDPKAMLHIFTKANELFPQSDMFLTINNALFGPGLASTKEVQHRRQRRVVNPAFSLTHLRALTNVVYGPTQQIRDIFVQKANAGPTEVDLHHWFKNLALEMIGLSGFSYSFDSLSEDIAVREETRSIQEMMIVFSPLAPLVMYTTWAFNIGPAHVRRFLLGLLPWKRVQRVVHMVDTVHRIARGIVEEKKKAMDLETPKQSKDLIDLLMRENANVNESERIRDDELIGQIITFIFAGMDTNAALLTRIVHLLTLHPIVQDRLREEIRQAQAQSGNNLLPFDVVMALPYLNDVYRETLRLYPSVPLATRMASQDTMLPVSTPVRCVDGIERSEIFVPKGTQVVVSILAANRNPKIWGDDASEWKPERWSSKKQFSEVDQNPGIYSGLMSFIAGPRACVGFKFAEMTTKLALVTLLPALEFQDSGKNVHWDFGIILSPRVQGKDGADLPVLVSLAKGGS